MLVMVSNEVLVGSVEILSMIEQALVVQVARAQVEPAAAAAAALVQSDHTIFTKCRLGGKCNRFAACIKNVEL